LLKWGSKRDGFLVKTKIAALAEAVDSNRDQDSDVGLHTHHAAKSYDAELRRRILFARRGC